MKNREAISLNDYKNDHIKLKTTGNAFYNDIGKSDNCSFSFKI